MARVADGRHGDEHPAYDKEESTARGRQRGGASGATAIAAAAAARAAARAAVAGAAIVAAAAAWNPRSPRQHRSETLLRCRARRATGRGGEADSLADARAGLRRGRREARTFAGLHGCDVGVRRGSLKPDASNRL